MKIIEDIKNILSKHCDEMELYDLIGELDTEDDMSFAMGDGDLNVYFTHEGHDIEVIVNTHYNVNKGFIKVTKDEVLKETIPFNYEVEV